MSSEKKDGSVTLLNRGKRHYDFGKDAQGNERVLAPGAMMSFTAEDAAKLSGYKELVDISKLPGQVDTTALKAENQRLQDEKAKLEAQLASLAPAPAEEPKAKGKKREESVA